MPGIRLGSLYQATENRLRYEAVVIERCCAKRSVRRFKRRAGGGV